MNKRIIWLITVVMAIAFIILLFVQISYMKSLRELNHERFTQGVRQALIYTSRYLEQEETAFYLEDMLSQVQTQSIYTQRFGDLLPSQDGVKLSFSTATGMSADVTIKGQQDMLSKIQSGGIFLGGHYLAMRENYRDHYLYHKGVLDDVVINIISRAASRPIEERADSAIMSDYLRHRLDTLGIAMPFEFAIVNSNGVVQKKSEGYNPTEKNEMFTQTLFPRTDTGDDF